MKLNPQNSEILSENEKNAIQKCVENTLVSKEKFSVDFNDFWQWAGYSRKDSAKRTLKKFFKEKKDFMIFDDFSTDFSTQKASNGRPEKGIKLTLDCAINLALKANSAKSNLVYDFILICKENFEKNNQKTLNNSINLIQSELDGIKGCVISNEKYPVIFTDFVKWVGYSRKDNAKRTLVENFVENIDFGVFLNIEENPNSLGGRPSEIIKLTTDCAKSFAMLAQTERGKEVRKYFLKCEKELLEITQNPIPQSAQNISNEIISRVDNLEIKLDIFAKAMLKNTIMLEKICDVQIKILEEQEELRNRILALEKQIPQKKIFSLMVILEKETNYHRIFTKENPVFHTENEQMYFEQSKVLFSLEFEQKTECKKTEKYIFGLLKLQKAHTHNDCFELKSHHFQMFETLRVN